MNTETIEKAQMFDSLPDVPPDPVFSLMHQCRADERDYKVDLTVGMFQDESGKTPILKSVKEAEAQILKSETEKGYLGIGGLTDFCALTSDLIFGTDLAAKKENRCVTIQTPGGTGALRVAAEFFAAERPGNRVWLGKPTWSNHMSIFSQAGIEIKTYSHLDGHELDFESMVDALSQASPGDAILMHTCCHNPTGVDPAVDQWEVIFGLLRERQLFAIFDCAYQGFNESLDKDMFPVRRLTELGGELFVCSSNSKNFGLYAERVGALSAPCPSPTTAKMLDKYLQSFVRAIYSNPPKHGGSIVSTILSSDELRPLWQEELDQMRDRIWAMRGLFVDEMKKLGRDFEFINRQTGMFSFTGLTAEQADAMRTDHAIYLLRNGRINVAGLNRDNIERICQAIDAVCG